MISLLFLVITSPLPVVPLARYRQTRPITLPDLLHRGHTIFLIAKCSLFVCIKFVSFVLYLA